MLTKTGIQGRRSWKLRRNRTAVVFADEIESTGHRSCTLRCQRSSRSVKLGSFVNLLSHESIGVAADIGHINTKSTVTGYVPGPDGLTHALKDAEIVLIPAGVPRKPGMTRDGTDRHHKGIP